MTLLTSTQFCSFLVVQPQTGDDLRVLNPYTGELTWIAATDVGPVDAPLLGRGAPPGGRSCAEAIYPTTRTVLDSTVDGSWRGVDPSSPAIGESGGLVLRVAPGGGLALAVAPISRAVDDVIVTATLRLTGATEAGRYGVFIRAGVSGTGGDSLLVDRFFGFWIDSMGRAGIMRHSATGWVDLTFPVQAVVNPAPERPVQLTVAALGNVLMLLVDGRQVVTASDAAPVAGSVGLFADGADGGFAVERVVVEDVEEGCWATRGDVDRQRAC